MEFSKKKQMTLGAVFSYLAIAAKLLSGILYTPIILQSLGQSEYGVYSLCQSFTGYLTIFNAGMNAAYVRFYVQGRETGAYASEKINGTFFKIFTSLGVIGMLAGFFIGKNAAALFGSKILPSEYAVFQKSMYALAATVFLTSLNGLFSSAIVAHEKFVVGKLVDLAHTVLVPVVVIPFLFSGYGSVTILIVQLILTALILLFNAAYSIKKLGLTFDIKSSDATLLRSIAWFTVFLAIQSVMDQLNWQVDKLILARVQGANEVAIYSVGSQFQTVYMSITAAASGVFIAEINRLAAREDNRHISDLFVRTSRVFAEISVFIMSAFIIFGRQFIVRWAGEGYEDSYFVAVFIMLPTTVSLCQCLGQDIARAKNLHTVQIVINICVCVLNVAVSIPLAMRYGAVGSALGTFGCEVIICIFVQSIYYQKIVGLNMTAHYREMLRIMPGWIIPFAFGWVLNHFGLIRRNYPSLFFYGVLYAVVYAISIWVIALSDSEKGYIKKAVKFLEKGKGTQMGGRHSD